MTRYSRDFMHKSSGVGTEFADKVKWAVNMVFSASRFNPSMNFEAMAKFLSEIFSSGLILLLSSSTSSKNFSMDSLAPLLKFHRCLMPLNTRAKMIQQDVKDFASTVTSNCPFRQHTA